MRRSVRTMPQATRVKFSVKTSSAERAESPALTRLSAQSGVQIVSCKSFTSRVHSIQSVTEE